MTAKTTFVALCGWMGAAAVFGDQACKDDSALKFLAHVEDGVQLMQIFASAPAENASENKEKTEIASEKAKKAVPADVRKKIEDMIASEKAKKKKIWDTIASKKADKTLPADGWKNLADAIASEKAKNADVKKNVWDTIASKKADKTLPADVRKNLADAIASEKAKNADVKKNVWDTIASKKPDKTVPADVMKKIADAIASKKKQNPWVPAVAGQSKTAIASEKTDKTVPAEVMKKFWDTIASKKKHKTLPDDVMKKLGWAIASKSSEKTTKTVPASVKPHRNQRREPRVVLYVTTVASEQHVSFLECYPKIIGQRMAKADVIMHVGEDKTQIDNATRIKLETLVSSWTSGKKTIHFLPNGGYARGAMKAMDDAFSNGWFEGYDWVIRMNPDVVIYDEEPLFGFMDMPKVDAVVTHCRHHPHQGDWHHNDVQTDFFAVRPDKLPSDAWAKYANYDNAEWQATEVFRPILDTKAYVTLAPRAKVLCRIHGGGIWHSTQSCKETLENPPWSPKRLSSESDEDVWQMGWANDTTWDETA